MRAYEILQRLMLVVLVGLVPVAHAQPAQRVALLIGNANYQVGRLTNPPQDVQAMETALNKLGFKVQKVLNANQNQMKRAVRDFGNSAQGADVAFLYYSGHGTQANGENYLLPVSASIDKESDYEVEAVSANAILRQIQGARPKAAILVLDACRDNPLAATTRSSTKGLGRMDAPTGTMIAFATAPNTVASDNGDYAKVLARELQKPGQELIDVFRNTTAEVRKLSNGKQEPRISEMSISERLYLAGPGTQLASLVPEPITPITSTGRPGQSAELSLDDLEKEEATRKEWSQWQARMKADFDKTAAFNGSADLQAKAWERFLSNWGQDNPVSREDDNLRSQARQRQTSARALAEAQALPLTTSPIAITSTTLSTYPSKPVTIVVPFAAGGPTDRMARDLAEALRKSLGGVSIVVDNAAGAGGTIGANRVAKAAADGYTLLFHHIGMATMPALYRNTPFKVESDFEYLGAVNEVPMTLIGRPSLPANSYKELSTWIEQNKGRINLGNAGLGSASHLCGLLFQNAVGVEIVTVPYKGTAPAMNDLNGGQIDLMCDQTTNTTLQIEAKKVKAYGVTTSMRLTAPVLKDLPTLQESGLKGFEAMIWHGLYAPRGTPADVLAKLNSALKVALKDPEFIKKQEGLGAVVVSDKRMEPAEHKKFVAAEIAKWSPIIKAAGVYAD